ncbi:unnamed protein product [Adineta steineri]|uniref:ABC transmembrane type-1 domain-containing protein n=1 Tax=Adineta steineri TaxID=433720 RepID=A0A819LCZ8_9BILA|nr:unnamed protein product [Adineta steineri]
MSIIAATAHGISYPLLMLVSGNVVNTFTDHSFGLCSWNLTNISPQYCPSGVQLISTNFYISSSLCNLTDLNITNSINFKDQIQKQSLYIVVLGCYDINKIHDGIGDKLALATRYIASFISGFALSFSIGWKLTLVILSVSPLIFISTVMMSILTTSLTSMELKAYGKAGAVAEEVLSSIRIVLSYDGQEREKKRYKQYLNEVKERGIRKSVANGLSMGVSWLIFYCSYALEFLIINIIASPHLQALAQARSAASFVWNIIDEMKELQKNDLIGNIKLSNVTFSYPSRSDIEILKNISFNVKQGQTIALVGSSGSGKSTCIQLLQRFYDLYFGSILIDDNQINKYNLKWLRENLGVVSQEPIFRDVTIPIWYWGIGIGGIEVVLVLGSIGIEWY